MTIQQVKQFNQEAKKKYERAVKTFEFNKGGFPFLPMYIFTNEKGQPRKRGWVRIIDNNYKLFSNKEKATL